MEALKALDGVVASKMAAIEELVKEVESIQLQKKQLAKVLGIEIEESLPAETKKESLPKGIQELIPEYMKQSAEQREKEVGENGTSLFAQKKSVDQPKKKWADYSDNEAEVTESKLSVTRKQSVEESKLSSTRTDESAAGSKLPAVSTAVSTETILPEESLWQHAKQKKFYVIFNGPMRGIYDEWHKVSLHVSGKPNIVHKSYKTLESAKDALKESGNTFAAKAAAELFPHKEGINKLRSLGKIHGESSSSRVPTISSIPTREEFEKKQVLTVEQYRWRFTQLVEYKEAYKSMGFYPVDRHSYGPKAIILPEASAETVYEFFMSGLVDTIYASGKSINEQFRLFNGRFKEAISKFCFGVVEGKDIYVKCLSSYPGFFPRGEDVTATVDKPIDAVHLITVGKSNMNFPPIDSCPSEALRQDMRDGYYIVNYIGLCRRLQNMSAQTAVRYKSATILLVSHPSNPKFKMNAAQERVLRVFERPILDLEVCKPRNREELCNNLSGAKGEWVGNHKCPCCSPSPKESSPMKSEEPSSPLKVSEDELDPIED
ncbi:hypothetical protein CRG98_047790 [Punica granatum]|uniref:Ribonuclease H1 N-terminal domain-containing protein n=2 Tax=Punica granatum TaxID=22663 RepID=A0A2I0HJD9_PUNGR|nr:hypothetical protein CRG98_047790 [Punica granatum]